MASDPRLNLINFAHTLLNQAPAFFGVPHATSCPTVQFRQQQGNLTAWGALQDAQQLGGAFANFNTGAGTGVVGAGLQVLAGISDTVRLYGQSSLPQEATVNGQHFVLNQVGIDPQALATAAGFNPSVANNALAAASQVYNSVSQGKFTASDIPAAFSAFQNGASLISSLFSPNTNVTQPPASGFGQNCGASPYAIDLIARAPKYKFMFVVEFEFDPAFQSEIHAAMDPAFVVKTATRPTVNFEYEEINMYNFRTRVPKKTVYDDISMSFYDDDYNNVMQLYTTYLKLVSPIANIDDEIVKMDPLDLYDLRGGGMGFALKNGNPNPAPIGGFENVIGQTYPASFGPFGVDPSTRNVLRTIRLYHIYKQGRMMNVYNFYNPKFTAMKMDTLDMAESGPTEITFTFKYDSMYIIPGYRIYNDTNPPQYNLPAMTGRSGLYPLGVSPTAKFNDGNPKDGFGIPYGQDVLKGATAYSPAQVAAPSSSVGASLTAAAVSLSNSTALLTSGANSTLEQSLAANTALQQSSVAAQVAINNNTNLTNNTDISNNVDVNSLITKTLG